MGVSLSDQERRSRRLGSGLTAADLLGVWRLEQVWPRRSAEPSPLNGALLRGLGAQLEIRAADPLGAPEGAALRVFNSVRLGALQLRFEGPARLQGRRPLLVFRFEHLELLVGSWRALERTLAASEPFDTAAVGKLPFFALIGLEANGTILSARGRGGGLAQWRRSLILIQGSVQDDPPDP
ncbi:hypothetical protein [Cyanobium sp. ATX 6F1]|uniref:hypothetical protein n=1 Tax=unclassified Cyanobium TaxID=2627006 RepID=UPI0020CC7C62|nr:hypothetical protein [Cyanobium sp. ATX 6F1]MCP9915597.1 hypothetical protein [Cyanobium sp. ATX 6F1]